MPSFTEILSEAAFFRAVQSKAPDLFQNETQLAQKGKVSQVWASMVSVRNVRREICISLGRDHPLLHFFDQHFTPSGFEHDVIDVTYHSEEALVVFPLPPTFYDHTNSLMVRLPLLLQPQVDAVIIKPEYNLHRRYSDRGALMPESPSEAVLNYFKYGELFTTRPTELDQSDWTRENVQLTFQPLHDTRPDEHPNFCETFANPSPELEMKLPYLLREVNESLHNIMSATSKPRSVNHLFDALNMNAKHFPAMLGDLSGDYSAFLTRMAELLLQTAARGMILHVVMDGMIAATTRFSGTGLRKHLLMTGLPSCGKSVSMNLISSVCASHKGFFTTIWLQSAAQTEWGDARFQEEADDRFRKPESGHGIGHGDKGDFRSTLLQWLENAPMGRARYTKDSDGRLMQDASSAGGFPACNYFGVCSNLAERDFDDAFLSRMHKVRVYSGMLEKMQLADAKTSGKELPATPETKALKFILNAAACLSILHQCGYIERPINPFESVYSDMMMQLKKCGAPMLQEVISETRVKERMFKQVEAGHAAVDAVVKALAQLQNEREGMADDFHQHFVQNLTDVLVLANQYWVVSTTAMVYELSANQEMVFGRTACDLVSVLRHHVLSDEALEFHNGYVSTTYMFDFSRRSKSEKVCKDVQKSTCRNYYDHHLEAALKEMMTVRPFRKAAFGSVSVDTPLLYKDNSGDRQYNGFIVHKSLLDNALTFTERMCVFILRSRVYSVGVDMDMPCADGDGCWQAPVKWYLALSDAEKAEVAPMSVQIDFQRMLVMPFVGTIEFELDSVVAMFQELARKHKVVLEHVQGGPDHVFELSWDVFHLLYGKLAKDTRPMFSAMYQELAYAPVTMTPPGTSTTRIKTASRAVKLTPRRLQKALGAVWARDWQAEWDSLSLEVPLRDLSYEIWKVHSNPSVPPPTPPNLIRALKMLRVVNGFACQISRNSVKFDARCLRKLEEIETGPIGKWLNVTSGLTTKPCVLTLAQSRPDNSPLCVYYDPREEVGSRQTLKTFSPLETRAHCFEDTI